DMFFGSRHNLVMPGRGVNMGDGWETRRSRREGPDWCVVSLATEGAITRIEIDTTHFKGNAPESAGLAVGPTADGPWTEILARTPLQPHTRHFFESEVARHAVATFARFCIWPDGGVSRLRLWGVPSDAGRERWGIHRLNVLAPDDALAELLACCGSRAWAGR